MEHDIRGVLFGPCLAPGVLAACAPAKRRDRLAPVDAAPHDFADLRARSVAVDALMQAGAAPGVEAPPGTLIAFATEPGAVAFDGEGPNSPYAEALARPRASPASASRTCSSVTAASSPA
ncbi:caspase family protein [Rubrimonas cliftonensis]|nr:caspase family protein [Rubrimonas cliftonensis]